MKKLFLFCAFFSVLGIVSVNAQCAKSTAAGSACCAKKSASATATASSEQMAKAAALDNTIVASTDKQGRVSYERKLTCPVTGKVTMHKVNYDQASAKFVNSDQPTAGKACVGEAAGAGKSCAKEASGACCAKKGQTSTMVAPTTTDKVSSTSM